MNDVTRVHIHENVLAVSISKPLGLMSGLHLADGFKRNTNPRMKPTIDITAAVRPYVSRLASQAVGSGKVSMNHSWNTGLNLKIHQQDDYQQ